MNGEFRPVQPMCQIYTCVYVLIRVGSIKSIDLIDIDLID